MKGVSWEWYVFLAISILLLLAGNVLAILLNKILRRKIAGLNSYNVLCGSVYLAAFTYFLPVYSNFFKDDMFRYIKTVLLSAGHALCLFIGGLEYENVMDVLPNEPSWLEDVYACYMALLLVVALILTAGLIFVFFKNLAAYRRYYLSFFREVYIFSELNEKSLSLAESLRANKSKKRTIVFTDCFEDKSPETADLMDRARDINAIFFQKDIVVARLRFHSRKKPLYFFAINEDEMKNTEQALNIIDKYKDIANTHLYVFSTSSEGELILAGYDRGLMKVRRINEARSLVYRTLYENKEIIFGTKENNIRDISVVLIGMGRHGEAMLKALCWFCQMDGFTFRIHVFDRDPLAEDKFYIQCPEIMNGEYNVTIHAGVDVDSKVFARELEEIGNVTYTLVALGSDAENIRVAAYVRMLFERWDRKPVIHSVVYNSKEVRALDKAKNYRNQPYAIDFIGDLETSYSETVILDSELEELALAVHMRYSDNAEEFWNFEYNYRSSMATALHATARELCGIKTPGKDEMTEEEILKSNIMEHRRWCAYVRTEGFVYSGSLEKASRNDLAKKHNNLVTYEELTMEDKLKDQKVVTVTKKE